MTFREWLKYVVKNRSNDSSHLFPNLKLKDGTKLSVQASEFHMCDPEENLEDGNYETVEVYTSEEEIEGIAFLYENSPGTYGHVPVEHMEEICKKHGGIC